MMLIESKSNYRGTCALSWRLVPQYALELLIFATLLILFSIVRFQVIAMVNCQALLPSPRAMSNASTK